MRLSEAIMLGSLLRPQAHGGLRVRHDQEWGSCALGAAFEAGKCPTEERIAIEDRTSFRGAALKAGEKYQSTTVPASWVNLFYKVVTCPDCGEASVILRMIPHLNDLHRWSRQAIAEWVTQFEPKPRKKRETVQEAVAKAAEK